MDIKQSVTPMSNTSTPNASSEAESTKLFQRPNPRELETAFQLLRPWQALTQPIFLGMENVPEDRPLLFVGNHTIYGVLDIPLLFHELYSQKDIFLRSLGDHVHFSIPIWRDFLNRYGVVRGTRPNCAALMKAGESILVFPGGGREVAKRKGEKYQLIWKERLGFAKMAIAHKCTIVPFSAVGVEDMFDILLDASKVENSPVGKWLQKLKLRTDVIMPISKGTGPLMLPGLQRFYFHIGKPICTEKYQGDADNLDHCQELRDLARTAVEDGIQLLLQVQKEDPDRTLKSRITKFISEFPGKIR